MPNLSLLLVLGLVFLGGCSDDDDDSGGDGDGDSDADADGDLPVECGNGVIDGDEGCEGQAGCDEGDVCTADCTCAPFPEGPASSQDLIEQALEAGTIDYHTSLLYRVWALFLAPELPEEYDGVGSRGEDTGLFFEIAAERAALPADVETAVAPYLVRPEDPDSIFSRTTAEIGGGGPAAVLCPANAQGFPDWRFHETTNFVIWSCGGGVNGNDEHAAARVVAGRIFEEAWSAMITSNALPPPRGDTFTNPVLAIAGPEPRSRIDVYLVVPNACRVRNGSCESLSGSEFAVAVADLPCDSTRGPATSSGYIVANVSDVPAASGSSPFRNTAAHELFHVITFGLNLEAGGDACGDSGPVDGKTGASWLIEASAEWASHSFFKDDEPGRRTTLFEEFQRYRDNARTGLQATTDDYSYNAFLYPAFIEEETGARDTMASLWTGSQSVRSARDFDDRLDGLFSFRSHFRDFSVRNFNRLLPGGPVLQPHESFDGALPFDREPYLSQVVKPGYKFGAQRYIGKIPLRVAPLAMETQHLEFVPELRWFKLDANDVGAGHLSIDALVKVGDLWERRRLSTPVFELCRDDPEDEEVSEAYVIFSNDGRDRAARIDGQYDVEKGPACPGGWSGTIRIVNSTEEHWVEQTVDGPHSRDTSGSYSQEWTIVGTRTEGEEPDQEEVIDTSWRGRVTWETSETMPPYLGGVDGARQWCTVTTTSTTLGDGGGDSAFTVVFGADGQVTFVPREGGNQCDIESHVTTEDSCGEVSAYDNPPGSEVEDFELFSFDLWQLDPDPRDPTRFNGDVTLYHEEEPRFDGSYIVDFSAHWQLRRSPDE